MTLTESLRAESRILELQFRLRQRGNSRQLDNLSKDPLFQMSFVRIQNDYFGHLKESLFTRGCRNSNY
jgi:hypothetical protein